LKQHGMLAVTLVAIAVMAGCNTEAEQRALAAETKLEQMNNIAAAKDSLTRELMATTTFMTQINDELSKAKQLQTKASGTQGEQVAALEDYREGMIERISELRTRLDESEEKLKSTQARLRTLAGQDKEMQKRVVAYDSMVAEYQTIMETQRIEIADLTSQVQTLQTDNQRLAEEKTTLAAQVTDLTTAVNTVFYVLGSKQELLQKGVVAETGGARVLGIGWKAGKTLVPTGTFSEEAFQRSTRETALEIPLPDPAKKYRLVSPQNVSGLESKPDKDGKFKGTLKIADPNAFWAPSKYLILVEG
jgi:myosin heavy subunit